MGAMGRCGSIADGVAAGSAPAIGIWLSRSPKLFGGCGAEERAARLTPQPAIEVGGGMPLASIPGSMPALESGEATVVGEMDPSSRRAEALFALRRMQARMRNEE